MIDDKTPSRPTNVRTLIFALSCATSFMLYMHRYTWGFVKNQLHEQEGWDLATLGWLDSLFNVTYAMGQIPGGMLCDWFGPRALLGCIIILWSISMGGVAIANHTFGMATARLAFGATQAATYPTLSKVTKLWFPLTIRTTVQGWVATFFGRGGGAMSFILFGSLLLGTFEMPWRWALGVLTILGIAFGVAFVVLFRNTPREHPWANDAEAELVAAGDADAQIATRSVLNWRSVARSGNMGIFFFQQFTSAYADNMFVYWIPIFLAAEKGVKLTGAGWMAAIPLMGGAVGGMLGGKLQNYLIHRTGNRRWSRSAIGCIGKMLATIIMFTSLRFDDAMTIVFIFGLLKFFGDWSQPTVWGTVTDVAGRNSGSVFGIVNTVGSIAAVVAGPTMGYIIGSYSSEKVSSAERVAVRKTDGANAIYEPLAFKNIVAGSVSGTLFDGDDAVATFSVSETGDVSFEPAAGAEIRPLSKGSKINHLHGEVAIAWSDLPAEPLLSVDYRYTDYGSGWTALFIALGLIYLASSLSWLFIDCTKKLEP